MKCKDKHEKRIVLHAFSSGNCKECDKEIETPHIPCDVVCDECSETKKLCTICGEPVNK